MARREGSDSAGTVEQILAATRTLLDTRGTGAVSIRAVAKLARVSSGTVTYYFPSREALLEGCLDRHHEWLEEEIALRARQLAEGQLLVDVAADTVRSIYRHMLTRKSSLRLRRLLTLERGELLPARRAFQRSPSLDAFARAWSDGAEELRARLVLQSITFLVTQYALLSDEESREVTGTDSTDAARALIEDHLVAMLLGVLRRPGRT